MYTFSAEGAAKGRKGSFLNSLHFVGHWILPLANLADAHARAGHYFGKNTPPEQAITVSLAVAEFQEKCAGRREIWYEVLLVDILKTEQVADSVRITVIADTHEQKLLACFQILLRLLPSTRNPNMDDLDRVFQANNHGKLIVPTSDSIKSKKTFILIFAKNLTWQISPHLCN